MTIANALKRFGAEKSGAMTIEYITIAAVGAVVAIALSYQIAGGSDGASGVTGLSTTVSGQLDDLAATLQSADLGGSSSDDASSDNASSGGPNGNGLGNGNGKGNNGVGYGNGGSNR